MRHNPSDLSHVFRLPGDEGAHGIRALHLALGWPESAEGVGGSTATAIGGKDPCAVAGNGDYAVGRLHDTAIHRPAAHQVGEIDLFGDAEEVAFDTVDGECDRRSMPGQ